MSFTVFPKDTDIYLCKGVPFDPDYSYTVYFHNNIEQLNVISQYVHKTFNDQSYQRASRGVLRVAVLADEIYDCNYLYFKNTAHGNKYFFCFIKGVTYINDRTTEVEYVIDSLQTYWFDFSLPACFVEREHTLSDNIGEYLEPENLELGDYVVAQYSERMCPPVSDGNWLIMIKYAINYNDDEEDVRFSNYYESGDDPSSWTTSDGIDDGSMGSSIFNRVMQAYTYIAIPTSSFFTTSRVITKAVHVLQSMGATIVDICMIPPEMVSDYDLTNQSAHIINSAAPHSWEIAQSDGFPNVAITGSKYYPKNNKLYTAPFCKIILTNNQGESTEYAWERFSRTSYQFPVRASFNIYTLLYPSSEQHCVPYNYNSKSNNAYEDGLIVTNFPTCPWSEDSYAKWEQTNGEQWNLAMISNVLQSGLNIGKTAVAGYSAVAGLEAVGNATLSAGNMGKAYAAFEGAEKTRFGTDYSVAKSGASALTNIAELVAQKRAVKATPDTLKGTSNNSASLARENRYGFSLYGMSVTGEIARTIDDFFSQFGYAINKIKVPNIMNANVLTLRPQWNYIKTRNCIVIPNQVQSSTYGMNSEVVKAIQGIFDNGITFWMNHQNVGKYNLSNDPPN